LNKHQIKEADLLKIDIEGAEFYIIEQDSDILKRFKYICCEIHGKIQERNVFKEKIRSTGFKVYEPQGPVHPNVEMMFAERLN
jgi:hypothetical protein